MDIQTEKIALVKRLLDTDSELVLQQVKEVFEHNEHDSWHDLPHHVKTEIARSRKLAEAGLDNPNEDMMKKYAKYL
jgi:hypothetical protein